MNVKICCRERANSLHVLAENVEQELIREAAAWTPLRIQPSLNTCLVPLGDKTVFSSCSRVSRDAHTKSLKEARGHVQQAFYKEVRICLAKRTLEN